MVHLKVQPLRQSQRRNGINGFKMKMPQAGLCRKLICMLQLKIKFVVELD